MRPSALTWIRWMSAVLLAALCLSAQAQERKKLPRESSGVQFIEPGATAPGAATNRVVKTENPEKAAALRGLSSSVRAPFSPFSAADSFSGTMSRPVRRLPVVPMDPKRAQELLDRRKNWAFLTPEELYGIKTPEEMLSLPEFGPDGELKERKSAIERYLDRMNGNSLSVSSNQVAGDALADDASGEESAETGKSDEKPILSFLGKSSPDQGFGTSLISPAFNQQVISAQVLNGAGGGGILGFGKADSLEKPLVRSAAQEASMLEFRQLLESRSPTTPPVTLPSAPVIPAPFSLGNPGQSLGGARSIVSSPLTPPVAIGVAMPGLSSVSAPMPEPPRRVNPSPATAFEIPRRKF